METIVKADREMFELAAKAAGLSLRWIGNEPSVPYTPEESAQRHGIDGYMWNPRDDDGDSRRLQVALSMNTGFDSRFKDLGACAYCTYPRDDFTCNSIMQNIEQAGSKEAATRLAVLRAAAEVGRAMP